MNKVTKFDEIDISKEVFDVSLPDGGHVQFPNGSEGRQVSVVNPLESGLHK